MALRKLFSVAGPAIDMTPMIDMTFQLIAFFMFVMNFESTESDQRIRLPVTDIARVTNLPRDEMIYLNLTRDGRLLAVGRELSLKDDKAQIEEYLSREARVLRARRDAATGDAAPGLPGIIVLRADKETSYRDIHDLVSACRAAGFHRFSLSAERKEP